MKTKAAVTAALFLLFAIPLAVSTQVERTLIFQQGFNGYEGTEDTFVQSGNPDQNNNAENNSAGPADEIEWDGSDAGGRNIALFKFNDFVGDGPNQVPPVAEIVSAVFSTFVTNESSEGNQSVIRNLLVEWDEQTVTYNSIFPGVPVGEDPTPGEFTSETSVVAPHSPSTVGEEWSADITELVQEIVNGLPNNGFAVVPTAASTNGFGHLASEATLVDARATLTVETADGPVTFKQGENGYEGLKDAWIGNEGDRFFTNYGMDGQIQLELDSPEDAEFGLIRFDDIFGGAEGQIMPGTEIVSANLSLYVVDTGDLVFVNEILPHTETVGDIEVDTFFEENDVTFENFVSDGFFPQFGVEIGTDPVAEFTPGSTGMTDIDVTGSLQKWSAGELDNYGWLLEPTTDNGIGIIAKDGSQAFGPPKLTVTYLADEASVAEYGLY